MDKNKDINAPKNKVRHGVQRQSIGEKVLSSDLSDGNQIVQMIYDAPPVSSYDR
tara:strand:+ start:63 stop:224 length:162 start_codon:yes stop_codon:yes gene_type:complete